MWYKLFIRYWNNNLLEKYTYAKDKWDLFAIIGWIYSTSVEEIKMIDYTTSSESPDNVNIIHPPRHRYGHHYS